MALTQRFFSRKFAKRLIASFFFQRNLEFIILRFFSLEEGEREGVGVSLCNTLSRKFRDFLFILCLVSVLLFSWNFEFTVFVPVNYWNSLLFVLMVSPNWPMTINDNYFNLFLVKHLKSECVNLIKSFTTHNKIKQ